MGLRIQQTERGGKLIVCLHARAAQVAQHDGQGFVVLALLLKTLNQLPMHANLVRAIGPAVAVGEGQSGVISRVIGAADRTARRCFAGLLVKQCLKIHGSISGPASSATLGAALARFMGTAFTPAILSKSLSA